jgi:hypothetical protein
MPEKMITDIVKSGEVPPKAAIHKLEYRIDTYKHMVPWPALIQSLERHLEILKARVKAKQ